MNNKSLTFRTIFKIVVKEGIHGLMLKVDDFILFITTQF